MKKFSVGIVTFNNEHEIESVLNSLENLSNRKDIIIYVVDNNSSDRTVTLIEKNYPNVNLIKNKKNYGFGRANNQVICKIDSDYHVLINPDITMEADTFVKIQQFMDVSTDIVQMAPCVLNENGTEQYLPKKYPEFKYLIAGRLENKCNYFKKLRADYTYENKNPQNVIDVDFCTGCFSVLRTNVLKKCKGFDERYFLYLEDADLTRMMQKYGRTVYNPQIAVCHKWERASGKSWKYFLIHLKSMVMYCWKWREM